MFYGKISRETLGTESDCKSCIERRDALRSTGQCRAVWGLGMFKVTPRGLDLEVSWGKKIPDITCFGYGPMFWRRGSDICLPSNRSELKGDTPHHIDDKEFKSGVSKALYVGLNWGREK